ncbi:glycosyltransferase N-terminal domain-containing protein [Acetobacter thailandicus]|uniref:glycosyltransferase N-terminal domain-containing protein n=1 Tax=Acetobacter thailandicus TaxID=1502842 RepID=UPI00224852E3|nr:glycosyltransferase N-terminal domain-containing protein [Acetobacter thailandicus]
MVRAYLGFALKTTRWSFEVAPKTRALLIGQDGQTCIIAFWHENLPLSPAIWWWAKQQNPLLRVNVLISRNSDGRLIAEIVRKWQVGSIAGSSDRKGKNKGGAAAIRRMRACLKNGSLVTITPDGPRGPRRVVQQGVMAIASMADKPVVPVGASCLNFRLKSWDKMFFPLPFGRGVFVCGDPIYPDRKNEKATHQLTESLTRQMTLAEEKRRSSKTAQNFSFIKPVKVVPSRLWYGAASVLSPALPFLLRWRQSKGKELPSRVREKMGFATCSRPSGKVIWFHAASVGEVVSVLPLVESCLTYNPDCHALVTTGTVTAAQLVEKRKNTLKTNNNIIHQFVPFDVPRWGKRFLSYWQPQVAVFTESELWPNLFGLCHAKNLPVILVNGRMSERSLATWSKAPDVIRRMLERCRWVFPRSAQDKAHFSAFGRLNYGPTGDIKMAAPPLPVDEKALLQVKKCTEGRPVFLAASTHEGEEEIILQAAAFARKKIPQLLTVIVPRHPERGNVVAALAGGAPRRSMGALPDSTMPVWVCDTLDELGLFYRVSDCVFIGNSLEEVKGHGGGHNPLEPARLDNALATGPLIQNFTDAFEMLGQSVTVTRSAESLAEWVISVLSDKQVMMARAVAAKEAIAGHSGLLMTLTEKIMALVQA